MATMSSGGGEKILVQKSIFMPYINKNTHVIMVVRDSCDEAKFCRSFLYLIRPFVKLDKNRFRDVKMIRILNHD